MRTGHGEGRSGTLNQVVSDRDYQCIKNSKKIKNNCLQKKNMKIRVLHIKQHLPVPQETKIVTVNIYREHWSFSTD